MWAYEDMNERAERRERLMADPGWRAYLVEMPPLLQSQESKILIPADFFIPQWQS